MIARRSEKSGLTLAFALLAFLGGCASGARPEAMIAPRSPDRLAPTNAEPVAVGAVAGGEDTNPLWTSEVSGDAFRRALVSSLSNHGLYDPDAGLRLDAVLENVEQPLIGFDMTVTSTVLYRVVDRSDKVLWEQRVVAPHTATVGDAFLGVERLRLANEGSIRSNIQMLMTSLDAAPIWREQDRRVGM